MRLLTLLACLFASSATAAELVLPTDGSVSARALATALDADAEALAPTQVIANGPLAGGGGLGFVAPGTSARRVPPRRAEFVKLVDGQHLVPVAELVSEPGTATYAVVGPVGQAQLVRFRAGQELDRFDLDQQDQLLLGLATCVELAGVCEPLDPCDVSCDGGAECLATTGGHQCLCPDGSEFAGVDCADIDECADSPCGAGTCLNQDPGYQCDCDSGYSFDGTTCTDVDECADLLDNCSIDATCDNTEGDFTCTCDPGYSGDGVDCDDVDECFLDTDDCAEKAECFNLIGGWECECLPGYGGDGTTCDDLDECADQTDACLPEATCVNTEGDYDCECPLGYAGDGIDTCDAVCGDGLVRDDEECDDDNDAASDGCFECAVEPGWACDGEPSACEQTCGDGVLDDLEECDDGEDNSDTEADACRTTCRLPSCGDDVVDSDEDCDDDEDDCIECILPDTGDPDTDTDPEEEGCGCDTGSASGWMLLLPLLVLRRRRGAAA